MEAIGLNPIRLDAIGIDPIRLNAIRLGVPGASSGSDRPYIAPEVLASLVAVVKCDGKSNNDPDRAIIKNLVDPDNPFVISNAAYKLNSGFGKYEVSFKERYVYNNSVVKDVTDESFNFDAKFLIALLYKTIKVGESNDEPSYKIKISNLKGELKYNYINDAGKRVYVKFTSDGEYTLPISYDSLTIENTWIGFSSNSASSGTITQIPSFQGSFYADGVNDMITSTKTMSEMLGGGNKCTVISFITHISGAGKYNVIGNNRIQVSDYSGQSFMAGCSSKSGEKIVELGDKEKIQAFQYNTFDSKLSIGSLESGLEISSYAYYGTFVFNKDSVPIDWIHQVIAYFYLDKYVTPGIIYDTIRQGITNENHASFNDELVDFSGNGHNLKIYNSAWKLGSGVGKYEEDFDSWIPQSYVGTFTYTSNKLRVTNIKNGNAILYTRKATSVMKVKVTGIQSLDLVYRYITGDDTWGTFKFDGDGIYELPAGGTTTKTYYTGFAVPDYVGDCDITIEQIPDYEGALVFDAVEDYGQFVGDLGLKDYTVAVDRAYPSLKGNGVPVISNIKSDTATPFLFEFADNTSVVRPYSFGATTVLSPMELSRKISYQSTYIYDGTAINKGLHGNTGDGLTIGRFGIDTQYANIALWSLLLFPYTLSEFLLERQLKRYKLGTLYPDMVEFRPIVKSNVEYELISFATSTSLVDKIVAGDYMKLGTLYIYIKPKSDNDRVIDVKINGIPAKLEGLQSNGQFRLKGEVTKSPQKINIAIDEYIHYEDIVQPYPFIIPIIDTDGKEYTYGDKIKVGTEIRGGINGNNLLPELYKLNGYFNFNGAYFSASNKHVIGKTNVFELTNAPTYLKANEPNCIADPQRLRIPNSSYKILGYIPDISGHGNHLKINNSAYAGMSGANGYTVDWSGWTKNNEVIITDSKITFPKGFNKVVWFCYTYSDVPAYKINVQGLPDSAHITYGGIKIHNGINELIGREGTTNAFGFIINQAADLSNLVIEQIGEYEGSFCLDGVEDYLTIPTLSHGAKQVLMKVRSFKPVCTIYEQRTPTGVDGGWIPTFCIFMNNQAIAYVDGNNGNTYIDGILNTSIQGKQLVDITHNITVTNENTKFGNTQSPLIGKLATSNTVYAQMALFTFMSFDDISSEEEIKELNDIVGIEGGYVESPDYYWDAYGKSNTQADDIDDGIRNINNSKMSIFDKSITGLTAIEQTNADGKVGRVYDRALAAKNFAFNEESGYSKIADAWLFNQWIIYKPNNILYIEKEQINNTTIRITKSNIANVDSFYARTNINKKAYYKITGLQQGQAIQFGYTNDIIYTAESDGVHEIDWSLTETRGYQELGCTFVGDCDIVIEQVAQYQNGLVSDGVDDELKNEHMPVLTDYTWIMKRKRLKDTGNNVMAYKGNSPSSYGDMSFMFELIENDVKNTRSFGINTVLEEFADLISYQTKTSYNGTTIPAGDNTDGNNLFIFRNREPYPFYCKGVFYKAMLYSKTIDMLSINMLKNLFEKDELIDVNNPIFKQNN